jgi:hypothetical protein
MFYGWMDECVLVPLGKCKTSYLCWVLLNTCCMYSFFRWLSDDAVSSCLGPYQVSLDLSVLDKLVLLITHTKREEVVRTLPPVNGQNDPFTETLIPRVTIKFDHSRLIWLSESSLLGWFLEVSLIVIIKGSHRYKYHWSWQSSKFHLDNQAFSPLLSQPFQFCRWFTGPNSWQN